MNVDFAKSFDKQFAVLPPKSQQRARTALAQFLQDGTTPSLRNHALRGKWVGHRSISAGGDLRLHFKVINQHKVLFVAIGTHSQLYK